MSAPSPSRDDRRQAALDRQAADLAAELGPAALEAATQASSLFDREDLLDALTRGPLPGRADALPRPLAEAVTTALLQDPALVRPGTDPETGEPVFVSVALAAQEKAMLARAAAMAQRSPPFFSPPQVQQIMGHFDRYFQAKGEPAAADYRAAFEALQQPGELKLLEGPPGAHKSEMMKLLTRAYRASGRKEAGIVVSALSDKITANGAAEADCPGLQYDELIRRLEDDSAGMQPGGLILFDEAGMLGSRQMDRLLQAADKAQARLILIGDDRQIPPLTAGQPFRVLGDQMPEAVATLVQTYRQKDPIDRQATLDLRAGAAEQALAAYDQRGQIGFEKGRKATLKAVAADFATWRAKDKNDGKTGIVLTNTSADAAYVNEKVRDRLNEAGALGRERKVRTADGVTRFAEGDQVILRERLTDAEGAVTYPGATGRVTALSKTQMDIALDGQDRSVSLDVTDEPDVRHAYAMDLRMAQGIKVKRAFVAITQPMDNGEALVAFSRHKKKASFVVDSKVYGDVPAMARDFAQPEIKPMSHEALPDSRDAAPAVAPCSPAVKR